MKEADQILYFNKATLPGTNSTYENPNIYPYGWTTNITKYSHQQGLNLNSIDQHQHTGIKESFIHSNIYDPHASATFNWYVKTIHANTNRHHLKWLASQTTIKADDIEKCQGLIGLYHKIDKLGRWVFHTQKGLHITVPDQKWVKWKTMSPDSHSDFTQVTWAQMTQFNQVAMMYALSKGQLRNKTIYLAFDNNAKHNKFWISELESMWSYVTELALHNGMYTQYNPFVYQELVYLNAPLKQTPYPNWNKEICPAAIEFPYSNMTIYWDDVNDEWYLDNVPAEQSPCDKTWDEPLWVTDRGAGGMMLTKGRVKG